MLWFGLMYGIFHNFISRITSIQTKPKLLIRIARIRPKEKTHLGNVDESTQTADVGAKFRAVLVVMQNVANIFEFLITLNIAKQGRPSR